MPQFALTTVPQERGPRLHDLTGAKPGLAASRGRVRWHDSATAASDRQKARHPEVGGPYRPDEIIPVHCNPQPKSCVTTLLTARGKEKRGVTGVKAKA